MERIEKLTPAYKLPWCQYLWERYKLQERGQEIGGNCRVGSKGRKPESEQLEILFSKSNGLCLLGRDGTDCRKKVEGDMRI